MISWLVIGVYVVGFMYSVVPLARFMVNDLNGNCDTFDELFACFEGFALAVFWPFILVAWFVRRRVLK